MRLLAHFLRFSRRKEPLSFVQEGVPPEDWPPGVLTDAGNPPATSGWWEVQGEGCGSDRQTLSQG